MMQNSKTSAKQNSKIVQNSKTSAEQNSKIVQNSKSSAEKNSNDVEQQKMSAGLIIKLVYTPCFRTKFFEVEDSPVQMSAGLIL